MVSAKLKGCIRYQGERGEPGRSGMEKRRNLVNVGKLVGLNERRLGKLLKNDGAYVVKGLCKAFATFSKTSHLIKHGRQGEKGAFINADYMQPLLL